MRSLIMGIGLALMAGVAAAQDARPVIASESDLPPTRFPVVGPPSEIYLTPAFLDQTLPQVRAEAQRLLSDYRIENPEIMTRVRIGLSAIALLEERPDDAIALIRAQRAASSKPQLKAVGYMTREAVAAGMQAPGGAGRCAATAARLDAILKDADPAIVRDEVIGRYGTVLTASPAFHAGSAALIVDPQAKAQGSIDVLGGLALASMASEALFFPPCRDQMAAALKQWIDDPAHQPVDIWPAREPSSQDMAGARPVTVAVMESGFDHAIFGGQMAYDPAEPLDGVDNDENGVVDDAFGPTFDYHLRPTPSTITPPSSALAARINLQAALEKGLADLRFGDDTPEARLAAARARDASIPEQVADVAVSEEWRALAHGTWVASLVADGAPFVRLYTVNAIPFGNDPERVPILEDDAERWAAILPGVAKRLNGAGVRIVNMSWVIDADEAAGALIETGAESDPERARVRGAAIYAIARAGIEGLIRACPDILFIAAAGNVDQAEQAGGSAPQSLRLPNLLVVGGAGVSGAPTAFTTYGPQVGLYALAEGNHIRGPGGQTMRSSGTSFASPVAARAAAAMLAVNPRLMPVQVIEGLKATATHDRAESLALLHTGEAVRWALARR